jgi:VacB/RNase II family 3'-5' exoribonuclease
MDIQKTGGHQWIPRDPRVPGQQQGDDGGSSAIDDQLSLQNHSPETGSSRIMQTGMHESSSTQNAGKHRRKHGRERWHNDGMRVHGAATTIGGNLSGVAAEMAMQRTGSHDDNRGRHVVDLKVIADNNLAERDLLTGFDDKVLREIQQLSSVAPRVDASVRDMRNMLWCSIDNDDSKDLDQLSVAEKLPNGDVKIYVAVADVDALVKKGSAIDSHAQQNTTSIYTPEKIYPMLPPELSTDLTSLNPDKDRLAIVIEYVVGQDGLIKESDVYRAQVNNHAKLAYNSVSAWLDGKEPMPEAAAKVPGMEEQLRMQDEVAQKLKERRHENGSLTIETIKPEIKVLDGGDLDIKNEVQNRAQEMIEDFMVAANGVTARFLAKHDFPTIMRVVKTPQRWDRIVQLAAEEGTKLPNKPDSAALERFMTEQKAKDPDHFPDLSLSIVKLLGRGEYVVQKPGDKTIGHFGLAVKDYAHSTAPNRRYPDLITQRLLKAALEGLPCPYTINQLEQLALQCTEQEKNADKAERQVNKSAMALELSDQIGQTFEAFVTGASDKGTWVRLVDPPAEGRLVQGQKGLDVGDKIKATLTSINIEKGFIDFARGSKH